MKASIIKQLAGAMGGQVFFLLTNMLFFMLAAKNLSAESFAAWGLYQMLIALIDGIRQGLIHNGLTRFLLQQPEQEGRIMGSALGIHLGFIALIYPILLILSGPLAAFFQMPTLSILLPFSVLSLLGLGSIQTYFNLLFAKNKSRSYFKATVAYLIISALGMAFLLISNQVSLISLLLLQSGSAMLVLLLGFFEKGWIRIQFPSSGWLVKMLQFGKHVAGTNALSLLFQKADLLMIAYFLGAEEVALFLVAGKVLQYVELPLSAISPWIYPRIAAASRSNQPTHLNLEYSRSILLLFVLLLPGGLVTMLFTETIIEWISSGSYSNAVPLVLILVAASFAKPWGRVFGMSLDAFGKPNVNFQMLALSLVINVILNASLIPIWGLTGAVIATGSSVILTVFIGQLRLKKYLPIVGTIQRFRLLFNSIFNQLNKKSHELNFR
ncbi:lipopolysaccharide biosynthesis protein [Algoriphagus limi]|uniref:Oligosaccharide flippase family protein n=1 Tax=Algoriphagus limi TaxID=2975273 RepID=A0ABT2G754_9BACT|nr:oligosaccharide flippase family protein [Algoriphagus limi]MCS5491102.1 oligosaccharide flippase family protein [Algoriphagus limi]